MNTRRQENIELLRVISMAMVITSHCLGHGGILSSYSFGEAGYFLFNLLLSFCSVAVNCFVLITGYFMIYVEMKISRILKMVFQVEFYSIICLVITKYIFDEPVGLKDIVRVIFPLTNNQYWFATSYLILMVLMPLLNVLVNGLSQKQHLYAIRILGVLFSVIPNFFFWCRNVLGYGFDFTWFVVLYITAAYIRKYRVNLSGKKCFAFYCMACVAGAISTAGGDLVLHEMFQIAGEGIGKRVFLNYNSVILFPAAIFLFVAFTKFEIKNKLLMRISKCGLYVFGAYLLSDHDLIRKPLWERVNVPTQSGGGNGNGGILGESSFVYYYSGLHCRIYTFEDEW